MSKALSGLVVVHSLESLSYFFIGCGIGPMSSLLK
jgi:hypothetical protein